MLLFELSAIQSVIHINATWILYIVTYIYGTERAIMVMFRGSLGYSVVCQSTGESALERRQSITVIKA